MAVLRSCQPNRLPQLAPEQPPTSHPEAGSEGGNVADVESPGVVIDIPFVDDEKKVKLRRPWWRALRITLLVAVVALFLLSALSIGLSFAWYLLLSLVSFVLILALVGLLLTLTGVALFRAVKAVLSQPKQPVLHFDEVAVSAALQDVARRVEALSFLGQYCSELGDLVRAVARRGVRDLTVRIGDPQLTTKVEPIHVFFEPVRLRERDGEFAELTRQLKAEGATAAVPDETDSLLRRRPVNWRQGIGLLVAIALAAFVLVSVVWVAADLVWKSVIAGRPHPFLLWVMACALVGGAYASWRSAGKSKWFAVPGGVLVRRSRPWDARWRSRYFDRRTSVLGVIYDHFEDQCQVTMADRSSTRSTILTIAEASLLLNAWCSPHRSPLSRRPASDAGV